MTKYLLLFGTCIVFFIIGTATDVEGPPVPYDADVIIDGTNLILISNQEEGIENARMLILDDAEQITDRLVYTRNGYSLAAMATDTLPLSSFTNLDNELFPATGTPSFFSLNFNFQGVPFFIERNL